MVISDKLHPRLFIARTIASSLILSLLSACFPHQYKPEPIDKQSVLQTIQTWSIHNSGLNHFLKSNGLTLDEINSEFFTLNRLYLTGLYYSPEMQIALKQWHKAKIGVENSAYQINPQLDIPFEHHSDTSDGQSQWTIGAVLSFIYERQGKREARKAAAQVEALNARLGIEEKAHEIYDQFAEIYYDYIVRRSRLNSIKAELGILNELLSQLESNYEFGAVSQFELSSLKLELQQRTFELSLQENLLQQSEDKLLAMTHLEYSNYDAIEIKYIPPIRFARDLYSSIEYLDSSLESFQIELLKTHHGLARKLNDYAIAEAELKLEIENQYPDIVLSPGFIFDQSDNIWALGLSWVLPLFTNTKQNQVILKALEERKIKQQAVLTMQKDLLNRLYQSYQAVKRYEQTMMISDNVVKTVQERNEQLKKQIELGGINQTALLRNQVELQKAMQTQSEIYHEAINSMEHLRHLVHVDHSQIDIPKAVIFWLEQSKEL